MKKWIAAVLCALAMLSAAGCAASPKPAATQPNTEEKAEAPAPAADDKTEAPAAEDKAETSAAEAQPEAAAPEAPAETQAAPEEEEPAEKQRIVGKTFRFTVPEDWEEREDGSYLAVGGSVIISFYAFPFTTDGYSMPEGIKVTDDAFAKEFVNLMSALDKGKYTYSLYSDLVSKTESGLDNRVIMINTLSADAMRSAVTMSVYAWNDEQVFAIMFEHGAVAGGYAEDCWKTVNSTLERID